MKDILAGIVLIAIGFVVGGSIFMGEFTVTSIFFDGLGIFWIVKGLLKVFRPNAQA